MSQSVSSAPSGSVDIPVASLRGGRGSGRPALRRILEVALLVALAVLSARLFLSAVTPLPQPGSGNVVSGGQAGAVADLAIFQGFDPFYGNAPRTAAPTQVATQETTLNITLVGTISGGDAPSAMISISGNTQKVFSIGDEVTGNAVLEEIAASHVILSRNGQREVLRLAGRELSAPPRGPSSLPPSRDPVATTTMAKPLGPKAAVAVAAVPTSAAELARLISIRPAPSGRGVILNPGSDRQFFEAAGLIAGDTLVAVNGRAVSSARPQDFPEIMRELSKQGAVLTLERGGRPVQVPLSLGPGRAQ